MISPELLRRFPFFAPFNEAQLIEISMIAEELEIPLNGVIFEEAQPADALYFLIAGTVELFYTTKETLRASTRKELPAGDINRGEVFAISALLEPHVLSTSARATQPSRVIKIEAQALRTMLENDYLMGYLALQQIAKALMERLVYTRVQLAAAWA